MSICEKASPHRQLETPKHGCEARGTLQATNSRKKSIRERAARGLSLWPDADWFAYTRERGLMY